jgi:hypothetical protein
MRSPVHSCAHCEQAEKRDIQRDDPKNGQHGDLFLISYRGVYKA